MSRRSSAFSGRREGRLSEQWPSLFDQPARFILVKPLAEQN
jgi:hypothetical protein